MYNNISLTDYRCQLESRIPESPDWAKHENMAYCEGYSALIGSRKTGRLEKMISALFLSLIK